MKLLRFGDPGQEKPGALIGDQIHDLSSVVDGIAGTTLFECLPDLASMDVSLLPEVTGSPRLGPPVAEVGKFICIGLNYADHARESGAEPPSEPILFFKATSAICGPYDQVRLPPGSEKLDWEVELGVVIGKGGREIPEGEAFEHVAGYCVINDISERHYQLERGGQWVKGKSADTFGPIGPYLVTRDEVPDPQALDLWLEVDGERVQDGNTKTMIFGVGHLVCYISKFMSLQPGDVISTGTPPGVGLGMKPPRYLKAGSRMRLGIEGLGVQEQEVYAG